jgi:AraC-like DNA-binding protein
MAIHTFTDFDAWGEAIRGAHLSLACDAVEEPCWSLAVRPLGDVVVQLAHEGGGDLCYGANSHPGVTLFLPVSRTAEYVGNGVRFDDATVLAIPPGADFRIHVRRVAHDWCSVALPADRFAWCDDSGAPVRHSRVLGPLPGLTSRLRDLITRTTMAGSLDGMPTPATRAAADAVMRAALGCLDMPVKETPAIGRPRLDRGEIIRRAVAVLDQDSWPRPAVADLAVAVGVPVRTLARAFHESFGVSPLAYIQLRLLHEVRRGLRTADEGTTVARILTAHGIWDFGRFGARYRRQFGETMSATLLRRR